MDKNEIARHANELDALVEQGIVPEDLPRRRTSARSNVA